MEFTKHLRGGWKGWKMITILSNYNAKRLGKHHQFNIFWLVFVFHGRGDPAALARMTIHEGRDSIHDVTVFSNFSNVDIEANL